MSNKLIVILGPTASGKTDLSIKLAKQFNGEIISADSRQVYKGMDIGSAKINKKEMQRIPHHLLSIASPKRKFSVSQYKEKTLRSIKQIQKRNKTPFLVGGSPFYIYSVIDNISIPKIKPDWKLRKELEKKKNQELFKMLKRLDPKRAKTIDKNNPRRLIRALEIIIKSKAPVPFFGRRQKEFNILIIGVKKTDEEIKKAIKQRLLKRLKNGMVAEVKKLRKSGVSWKRLEEFGLEYRFIARYLQDKITYDQMIDKIQKESERFVKKQMAWFKKDKRIKWTKNYKETIKIISNFV